MTDKEILHNVEVQERRSKDIPIDRNEILTEQELLNLAGDFPYDVINNCSVTSDFLNKLVIKGISPTYLYIANNLKASQVTLAMLAVIGKNDGDLQEAIARNPNTPQFILEEYAEKSFKNTKIREALAMNISTPANILKILATDEYDCVKEALLNNPNIPSEILDILSNDKSFWFKGKVVSHPNINRLILKKIFAQTSNIAEMTGFEYHEGNKLRYLIAESKLSTSELLDDIARDKNSNFHVLEAVANNPNVSLETIKYLVELEFSDMTENMFEALKMNSNTPHGILNIIDQKERRYEKERREIDESF